MQRRLQEHANDAGQCFPGHEGTCDLLACTNAADGKVGFRLLQSKKNRGGGDKGELTLEYKFSEDGASSCNRFLCTIMMSP